MKPMFTNVSIKLLYISDFDNGNDDDDDYDNNIQPLVDDNLFNAIEEGMRGHQSFSHNISSLSGG